VLPAEDEDEEELRDFNDSVEEEVDWPHSEIKEKQRPDNSKE
jgi:hypothetical protein